MGNHKGVKRGTTFTSRGGKLTTLQIIRDTPADIVAAAKATMSDRQILAMEIVREKINCTDGAALMEISAPSFGKLCKRVAFQLTDIMRHSQAPKRQEVVPPMTQPKTTLSTINLNGIEYVSKDDHLAAIQSIQATVPSVDVLARATVKRVSQVKMVGRTHYELMLECSEDQDLFDRIDTGKSIAICKGA